MTISLKDIYETGLKKSVIRSVENAIEEAEKKNADSKFVLLESVKLDVSVGDVEDTFFDVSDAIGEDIIRTDEAFRIMVEVIKYENYYASIELLNAIIKE